MTATQSISRRSFLMGSAAAIAATQFVGAATMEAIAAPVEAAAPAAKAGSWGYSLNGDEWTTGFSCREDAIAEAMSYGYDGDHYETGFCAPQPFHYPDADSVAQWLSDAPYELGWYMAEAFLDHNEDCDWEGGLHDEVSRASTAQLDTDARAVVSAALIRHGQIKAAAAVMMWTKEARGEPIIEAADVLDAIAADQTLSDDIKRVVRAWVDVNGIEDAPRTLDVSEQQDHEFPADVEAA